MGLQAKIRAKRAAERKARAQLNDNLAAAGVTERVQAAYLALQREDVQKRIREKITDDHAPWAEQIALDSAAASALREFGYNLDGVTVTAHYRDGDPPLVWFKADASDAAVIEAGGFPSERPVVN